MTAGTERRGRASDLQRILHGMNAVRGGSGMLNVPAVYRMRGPLDTCALAAAMTRVVARHSALRTEVVMDGGELVQVVRPPRPQEIGVAQLNPAGDVQAAIDRVIAAETAADLAYADGLPFAVSLYRIGDEDHLMIIKVDHLVTDAWSNMLIYRDLGAYYNGQFGRGADLPDVTWQFQDYVDREALRLRGAMAREHRDYWRGQLTGLKAVSLRPAPDRPRGRSVPGGNMWFTLDGEKLKLLADLGRQQRASLFVVLLSIFYAVLYERTGRLDIPVGSVFANRARPEVHQTVGVFANMVVLRVRLPEAPSFTSLLGVVRRTVLQAMDHQEYPYSRVFRMAPEGEQPASTVFHMLALPVGCAPPGGVRFHELDVRPVRITEGPGNRFDLELLIFPQVDGADGLFRYSSDQYDRDYVAGLARAYTSMAARVLAEPSLTLRVGSTDNEEAALPQPAPSLDAVALPERPVLGFDLDLTLLDLRQATACALSAVNTRLGEHVDVDAIVADLGPPFRAQLKQWIPDERRLRSALLMFRRVFLDEGLAYVTALPGARQALDAVYRLGGYAVVITGRRADTAAACLSRCGIAAAALVGGVIGMEKVEAMRSHRIDAYIGDHPLDMQAACAAPVPGIGVATGSHSAQALLDAGAATVIGSLDEVAAWCDGRARARGTVGGSR